jgi:hypothetical protein
MAQVFNRGGRRERIKRDDSVVRVRAEERRFPSGMTKLRGTTKETKGMTNEKGAASERCRVKMRQNDFERERLYERR